MNGLSVSLDIEADWNKSSKQKEKSIASFYLNGLGAEPRILLVAGSIPLFRIISNPASIGAQTEKSCWPYGATRRRELGDKRPGKGYPQTPKKMSCEKDRKAGWQVDVDEKDPKTRIWQVECRETVRPRDSCLGRCDKIDGVINS